MPEEFFESDAPVEVLSSTASERKLHLSDGTTVWLNNGAKLKYPASFEADNRTVYLEGEAYFEVRHQAGRPFYVRTDNGIVKEYGTSFNVNRNKSLSTLLAAVAYATDIRIRIAENYIIFE